jgi:hypothetical protein
MNIAVDAVGPAVAEVEKLLADADEAVAMAVRKVARLIDRGVGAAMEIGIHPFISKAIEAAGNAQASLGGAAGFMGDVHRELHDARKRLGAPVMEAAGGGWDKGD